jgi:hypothetical protein
MHSYPDCARCGHAARAVASGREQPAKQHCSSATITNENNSTKNNNNKYRKNIIAPILTFSIWFLSIFSDIFELIAAQFLKSRRLQLPGNQARFSPVASAVCIL